MLDPAFVRDLRAKAIGYLVGADQYESSTKARFPKRITEDPLFQAISYLRRRFNSEQKIVSEFPELLNEILGPEDPEPAKLLAETFINAVRQGAIGRLNDIVKLCDELHEAKILRPPKERQSDPRRWHYYAGIVTWQFLKDGTVPTKKQVEEAALRERAIVELPVCNPDWKPKEIRIDTPGDARRYYEAQQGEPDHDPNASPETPVKHDLSDKKRQRIFQLQQERIIQWQREQQAKSRTQQIGKLAEEKKPALVKDREKRIAAKIEELRLLYKPETWARNWARIFRDLGLSELPHSPTHPAR